MYGVEACKKGFHYFRGMGNNQPFHGAVPHPYQRRRQEGSAPLIKYPPVLWLFNMPQKYALLVAYKADCGGRVCGTAPLAWSQHQGSYVPRSLVGVCLCLH
jgi:hypothetical protein